MKKALLIVGVLVALVLVAALALPFLIDANRFRPRLEEELSKSLGREVKLGDLQLALLSGGVSATDLSIADDAKFGKAPFLSAKSLKVGVELKPLIFDRKLRVTGIEVERPEIVLIQDREGNWNFSSIGNSAEAKSPSAEGKPAGGENASSEPLDLSIALLKISDGRISLQKTGGAKPQVLEKVNLTVKDFQPSAAFPMSLSASIQGGGDLTLDGTAGPIDFKDTAQTPFKAKLKLAKFNPVAAGFVDPSTGFGGILALTADVQSNGHALQLAGDIDGNQLKLAKRGKAVAQPVGFDFALAHDMDKRSGRLSKGNIHIGKANAALAGTYRTSGEKTALELALKGPAMPIQELTALLPSLYIVLPNGSSLKGGTAAIDVKAEGTAYALVSEGTLSLNKTQLTGFDLGKNVMLVAQLAGIQAGPNTDIDVFSIKFHDSPQGLTLDPAQLIAPNIGELTGAGTVSPNKDLDFKMQAKVKYTGGLLSKVSSKGETTVPFSIRGTAAEPKFVPDAKGLAKGLATDIANQKIKELAPEPLKGLTPDNLKKMKPQDAVKTGTDILNQFFGGRKKQDAPATPAQQ
jgi:AsmA protein